MKRQWEQKKGKGTVSDTTKVRNASCQFRYKNEPIGSCFVDVRQNCIRYAMLEQLQLPPPGFEEIIRLHYRIKKDAVLKVRAYTELGGRSWLNRYAFSNWTIGCSWILKTKA